MLPTYLRETPFPSIHRAAILCYNWEVKKVERRGIIPYISVLIKNILTTLRSTFFLPLIRTYYKPCVKLLCIFTG